MNISTKAIVSNSEMIKNYKACREKAEILSKIFILKNNQPDAVLFSIAEYEEFQSFSNIWKVLREKIFQRLWIRFQKKGSERHTQLKI